RKLQEERDKTRWALIHRKPRTLVTTVGEITILRRYYRDKQTGERRFLLDDALGLEPHRRLSPQLRSQAIALAMEMSYRRAASLLQAWVPEVSAMAIWEEVQRLGEEERAKAERAREEVFGQGIPTPGKRAVETLHVEADGVYVRRRRRGGEDKAHLEVKLAVAYEGKEAQGSNRRRALVGRHVVAGTEEGESFWEQAVTEFGRVWDWSSVRRCWLGTDGAAWAKQGMCMLPGARHRLDPFHLRQALVRALGRETKVYRKVWEALSAEDGPRVEALLTAAAKRSQGTKKKQIEQLKGYLKNHWDGIVSSDAAVSLGAIEGQVFHHVARRMKRHGARWSERGADALVRLMAARANGEPVMKASEKREPHLATRGMAQEAVVTDAEMTRKVEAAASWLEAHMPALAGPHASRPWVKYVLRELARLPHTIA
ncbi:ISLre2 family transposase, partial [Alicyclobacillus vulcanalis]